MKNGSFEFEVNGNILEAKLYDTGIKEVMEKVTQDKANMLSHSDQVFNNAEYLYSLPDYEGNPNVYRWNYFYTPVQIGDTTVGVRIAVRDMKQTESRRTESQIYNWGIKKAPTLDGGSPEKTSLSADVSSVGEIDASLDGTRRLPSDGSVPGDVSSEASEASAPTTSIPTTARNVNSENGVESDLGSKSPRARTSQTAETIMEADITSDERAAQLNPYVQNGRFDYIPDTNARQTHRAEQAITEKGWTQAVQEFHDSVVAGKSGKDLVARGAVLLNNAGNSDASSRAYLDLASDVIELGHRAGETLQAFKILQQLIPQGRLYLMEKTVEQINRALTDGQKKSIAKEQLGKAYDRKAMMTETVMRNNWRGFTRQMDLAMGAEATAHGHIYDPKDIREDGSPIYPDPNDKTKPRNGHKLADDLVMYCLRHTYCTDLGKKGVPIEDIKYLMGHEDISTTLAVYSHPGEEAAERAAGIVRAAKQA